MDFKKQQFKHSPASPNAQCTPPTPDRVGVMTRRQARLAHLAQCTINGEDSSLSSIHAQLDDIAAAVTKRFKRNTAPLSARASPTKKQTKHLTSAAKQKASTSTKATPSKKLIAPADTSKADPQTERETSSTVLTLDGTNSPSSSIDSPLEEVATPATHKHFFSRPNTALYVPVNYHVREWDGTYNQRSNRKNMHSPKKTIKVDVPNHAPVILPLVCIDILRSTYNDPHKLSGVTIMEWLKSNEVLPIVKLWYDEISDKNIPEYLRKRTFVLNVSPWYTRRAQIQQSIATGLPQDADPDHARHIAKTAKYAQMLVKNNPDWFKNNFSKYELSDVDKYEQAIAVLLTAWYDLESNDENGFFATLLNSKLAISSNSMRRKVLDNWYILDKSRIGQKDHTEPTGRLTVHPPVVDALPEHRFSTRDERMATLACVKLYTDGDHLPIMRTKDMRKEITKCNNTVRAAVEEIGRLGEKEDELHRQYQATIVELQSKLAAATATNKSFSNGTLSQAMAEDSGDAMQL